MRAHPTALVDPAAQVAGDVEIGPFSLVGPGVRLGPGCRLGPRVSITGPVTAGRGNVFHANVRIGGGPLETGPVPEGRIEIGDQDVFREGVTVCLPVASGGVTRIGSRNRFHACAHVGPGCSIGDDVLVASSAVLPGGAVVEDGAWIEGQGFIREGAVFGRGSWTLSHADVQTDVPPFMRVEGEPAGVVGVVPRRRTDALERAFETLWRSGRPFAEALADLDPPGTPEVTELVAFLRRSAGRSPEVERG